MARPTLREKAGAEIAYQIKWDLLGYKTVMRCGGSVLLVHQNGTELQIHIFDKDNPYPKVEVDKEPKVS